MRARTPSGVRFSTIYPAPFTRSDCGLTATPRVDAEADTFEYFGEPVYQYLLKQGIEDGFLAPFEVARVLLSTDLDGVTIAQGTVDDDGLEVPAKTYKPKQLERRLVIPARTEEAAGWVSRHLAASDRMAKTIVFCVDQGSRIPLRRGNWQSEPRPDGGVRFRLGRPYHLG